MSNTLSHAHNNFLCYKYDWHIQKFNDESRDPTIHGVIPKKQSRSVYQHLPYYIQTYLLYICLISRDDIFIWYAICNIVYIQIINPVRIYPWFFDLKTLVVQHMFTTSCNLVWRSKVNAPITESLKEQILLVNNKYNRNNFFNYLLLMSTCKKKKKVCSLIYLTKEIREKATIWTLFHVKYYFSRQK